MYTITRIDIQKKNKKRFNLYADDLFLFDISDDTLVQFAIHKGRRFSDDTLKEILQYDRLALCLTQAYRYLSRRPHLKKELKTKLIQKKFDQSVIEQTLIKLKEQGYIDDADFITRFIADQKQIYRNGPLLIRKKLITKGAQSEMVDVLLKDLYTEEEEEQNADYWLNKKLKRTEITQPLKEKQQLGMFLQRKGFNWSIITRIVQMVGD
ncbi:MAG: hypothetical protein GF313_13420 [Caldithrix sp.]|nr:hypothetical protein [Caldithrix sp.]